MYSVKTSGELWTYDIFQKLFGICGHSAVELFTYSYSTASRAALLAAGFHLAKGRGTGQKLETTIALTPAALLSPFTSRREMLSQDWFAKWNRSCAKAPTGIPPEEQIAFESLIRNHPQWHR